MRLLAGAGGAVVLFWLTAQVPSRDSGLSRWIQELGWSLGWIGTDARVMLWVLSAAVVIIGVATRTWRLVVAAVIATATATAAVLVLVPLSGPDAGRQQTLDSLAVAAHFPLLEVAVPVAILTVSGAYLARPVLHLLWVLLAVSLAAVVVGEQALLFDLVASALAGWAAAGLAGLAFAVPVGDPLPVDVARNLDSFGLTAHDTVAAGHPAWGTARFRAAADGHGGVVVDVHGREAQDAQAFQRMWHAIMDKQGSARVAIGRREQAEHEALCLGLAQRANVPVPTLVTVGAVGAADDGYVVVADNGPRPWQTLDPQEVDDNLLRSVWHAVKACHQSGLAHNLLDAQAIEVLPDGSVQLTDWFIAQPAAGDSARDHDVATVLLTTAGKVGAKRAVAAAIDVVGVDVVTAALPLCQLGVLDRRSRDDVDKHTAADLRTEAATALDVTEPDLAELHRVSRSDLLLIGGSVLGFWLLYKQLASLGDIWATLANAAWAWVAVVLVLGQAAVVFTAIGLRGAVIQKLALGRVIALEYADQFTGLVGGTVAITATNIRFFQRQGLAGATAVTSGVTSSLAGGVIQVTIIVISLPFLISNDQLHLNSLGGGSGGSGHAVVIALIVIALVSGIVTLVPRFRSAVARKVKPEIHKARGELRDILHRPRNLLTMLGGQFGAQLAFALALGASLHAYGGSLPIIQLLVINTFASLIGGLAPVPGGMGAIEAGLIAGFTAFGVDATLAGAATFTYRLFTAYLPPAWGWPTLTWLRKHELL